MRALAAAERRAEELRIGPGFRRGRDTQLDGHAAVPVQPQAIAGVGDERGGVGRLRVVVLGDANVDASQLSDEVAVPGAVAARRGVQDTELGGNLVQRWFSHTVPSARNATEG